MQRQPVQAARASRGTQTARVGMNPAVIKRIVTGLTVVRQAAARRATVPRPCGMVELYEMP